MLTVNGAVVDGPSLAERSAPVDLSYWMANVMKVSRV